MLGCSNLICQKLCQQPTNSLFGARSVPRPPCRSLVVGPDKFLHGQKLARFHLAFTRDRRNWTNFLSVQVWDLKKAGQLFARHGSNFVRTGVNTRTVQVFADCQSTVSLLIYWLVFLYVIFCSSCLLSATLLFT